MRIFRKSFWIAAGFLITLPAAGEFHSCVDHQDDLIKSLCEDFEIENEGFFPAAGKWVPEDSEDAEFDELEVNPGVSVGRELDHIIKTVLFKIKNPRKSLRAMIEGNDTEHMFYMYDYKALTSNIFVAKEGFQKKDSTSAHASYKITFTNGQARVVTYSKTFTSGYETVGRTFFIYNRNTDSLSFQSEYTPVRFEWPRISHRGFAIGNVISQNFFASDKPHLGEAGIYPKVVRGKEEVKSLPLMRVLEGPNQN